MNLYSIFINHKGKEHEKECICITESLCCIAKLIQHCKLTKKPTFIFFNESWKYLSIHVH